MSKDEREGLPSASNAWIPHCLGSGEAIRCLPPLPDDTSEAANLGTKRHDLAENEADEFDTQADEYSVTRALELKQEAIEAVFGVDGEYTEVKEQRLWLVDDNMQPVMSGKFDHMAMSDSKCLILDYKMMYGHHGDALDNDQLAKYVVLVADSYDIHDIYVGLIQPNLSARNQLTMCRYGKKEIPKLREELLDWLELHTQNGHLRNAGSHCTWCPARLSCPKVAEYSLEVANTPTDIDRPTTVEMMDKVRLAEKIIKDLKTHENAKALKQLTDDPDSLPGYRINAGKKTKSTDMAKALEILSETFSDTELIKASTISIPKLVKPYQDKMFCSSQKEARTQLDASLKDAITTKIGKAFIEKK